MKKLARGVQQFHDHVFAPQHELFEKLLAGQRPRALFISCSDSRVIPEQICQAEPGELFVIRNAGNIVPPYMPESVNSVAATLEYGLRALRIPQIVICGHTHCGAMEAALRPETTEQLPCVRQWLGHVHAAASIVRCCYAHLPIEQQLDVLVQENVLIQLEHLRSHPAVATALAAGELNIYCWVYQMETGEVYSYDGKTGHFVLLRPDLDPLPVAVQPLPMPRSPRLLAVAPPLPVEPTASGDAS